MSEELKRLFLWHPIGGERHEPFMNPKNWLEIPADWMPGLFLSRLYGTKRRTTKSLLFDAYASDPERTAELKREIERLSDLRGKA